MVAFGHTAVGVGVGLLGYHYLGEQNPAVGLIATGALGVISHYAADFIPHGHFYKETTKKRLFLALVFDLGLSILLFVGLAFFKSGFSLKFLYILFGIGGSQLPDVVGGFHQLKLLPQKGLWKVENRFHWYKIHWHGTGSNALLWGKRDLWQVMIGVLSLIALLRF